MIGLPGRWPRRFSPGKAGSAEMNWWESLEEPTGKASGPASSDWSWLTVCHRNPRLPESRWSVRRGLR